MVITKFCRHILPQGGPNNPLINPLETLGRLRAPLFEKLPNLPVSWAATLAWRPVPQMAAVMMSTAGFWSPDTALADSSCPPTCQAFGKHENAILHVTGVSCEGIRRTYDILQLWILTMLTSGSRQSSASPSSTLAASTEVRGIRAPGGFNALQEDRSTVQKAIQWPVGRFRLQPCNSTASFTAEPRHVLKGPFAR